MLTIDDYNGNPDPGEMQPPIISAREAARIQKEYAGFIFYRHMMEEWGAYWYPLIRISDNDRNYKTWDEIQDFIENNL